MHKPVAIILQNRLEAMGLSHLLHTHFDTPSTIYESLADVLNSHRDKYKMYVTSEYEVLKHLSFFMPHSEQTIIVSASLDSSAGFNVISPLWSETELVAKLGPYFANIPDDTVQNHLTPREMMVLQLVVQGFINKEIADQLHISINTVLTHRKNITAKLGIKSVSGLSVYAIMNGIITPK
ncbi:MAG: response regulator transcription factor [Sodaliphilus sp.]